MIIAKRAVRNGTVLVTAGYPVLDLPAGSTVDPALALAIIRQESQFNAGAISPAGARGLMQLMLPTAQEMAGDLGISTSSSKLLNDPQHNMRLGMAYIQEMLETQNGSFVRAIASYNAGPGRVRQWVGEMGDPHAPGIDIVDWIEEIPYEENAELCPARAGRHAGLPHAGRRAGGRPATRPQDRLHGALLNHLTFLSEPDRDRRIPS